MTDRYLEILSGRTGHDIPSGRQLHRTPPLPDVKRHLDFCNEESSEEQNMEQAATRDNDHNGMFDFNTPEPKAEHISHESNSMLRGMKGYRLTPSDLDFIKKMKEEKLVNKLQEDLEEVQRMLNKEMMAVELAYASKKKAMAELKKFPSCEELTEWVKVVLKLTSPSTEWTDVDPKSLLAIVTKEDVQRAVDEKRTELPRMEKMVANKRKKEAKARGQLEKEFASEQLKIQGLMSQLSDLKSELAQQQEACKACEKQIISQEAPEITVAAEEADTAEELQAAKSQAKHRGKKRKKAVKSADTTTQSKSTGRKHTDGKTDNQTAVQHDHANKNTSLKTKLKSVNAARGPQTESVHAVGGGSPPGTTQNNQSKVTSGEASRSRKRAAGAADDAGTAGLRRSKRIASRT